MIPAIDLWNHKTVFYDLFVPFKKGDETKLYTIPVIITNNKKNQEEADKVLDTIFH